MRHYEGKTKEELLEIIEQLEEKVDFLSSHSSPPSQERFRDKYSTRILDALPDMLTVFDHDANIIELASSPATNHVEGINASNITTTNVKDILPEEAYESVRKNMDKVILTGESSTARHDLMLDGVLHHYENRIFLWIMNICCVCAVIYPTMGGRTDERATTERAEGRQSQGRRVGPAEICFSCKHEP